MKIKSFFDKIINKIEKHNLDNLYECGLILEKSIKTHFKPGSKNTGGNMTIKGGKKHYASVAGEIPAVDTGRLKASIATVRLPDGVGVGTNVKYAKSLEYGDDEVAARPFVRPAIEREREKLKKILRSKL